MTREDAIKKLIESGMSEQEANAEFNATVNYYLRGTLRTATDRNYAVQCAIDDIMDEGEEVISEHDQAMLALTY